MNSSITTPKMQAAHTPTLEVRFDDRHNRADIYVGNLLIGEAYTGGKNPSTRERIEWSKAVRACNSHAALLAVAQSLLYWNDSSTANISDQAARELGPIIAAARAATENL